MTEAVKSTPNKKLRREREHRCWTQQELADLIGTTPLNIGRWERGVTQPGPFFRQKLCQVFEKSAQELGLLPEGDERSKAGTVAASTPATPSARAVSTALWNVPYHRNPFFTGREDILTHLHDVLSAEVQPVALTQTHAISGLGGIGKTQAAIEYTYRYRDNYQAVFWAKADSHDLLISDCITIAVLLNLPERTEQDQASIVHAVIRWLDSHTGWLLILDNADNLQVVEEFIPSAGKGHVLLTTRAHSTGTVAQRIELEKMGLDEGTLFLLRRMKKLKGAASLETIPASLREQAQAIVEAVDGLPLALDQAGAYTEETGCSLTDYFKLYKTRRNRLLRTRGRDASGHPEPVAATWSLSFDNVERANPAAAELLRLCAFLHPDAIPETMIVAGASELGSPLQAVMEDELDLNEAISELHKYSLVRRDPELKLLNIHRLVQAVLKDGMDKETQRQWAERTVRMVNKAFPETEAPVWPTCQQYLPHAQLCGALIEQWDMHMPENAQLLNRAGNYLRQRAQHAEAERLLKQALKLREQALGPEHPDVATTLNDLALLYYHQSSFEQAEPLYVQAINIREKQLGLEHPQLADSLHNLAALYDVQGKYTEAGSLYRRALLIRESVLGLEHPGIARILTDLSWHYVELGKYDAAEPLAQRALVISEKAYGPVHPDVAYALNSIAWLYYNQGTYALAEQPLQRALEINEQLLGSEHPEVAISVNNLAKVYHKQGKYAQVESLFQQALATFERAWGREHPDVAQCLHNLAELYREQGRYTEAETFYLQAVTVGEKTIGAEHPHVARYFNNLALLYTVQGRYADAESLFQRALAIRGQRLGAEHPEVATTLEGYANLLRQLGRENEAAMLEARAQAIREQAEHTL